MAKLLEFLLILFALITLCDSGSSRRRRKSRKNKRKYKHRSSSDSRNINNNKYKKTNTATKKVKTKPTNDGNHLSIADTDYYAGCCELVKGHICFCKTHEYKTDCDCDHIVSLSVVYIGDDRLSHIKIYDTHSKYPRCKFNNVSPGDELLCDTGYNIFSDSTTFKLKKEDGSSCIGYVDTSCNAHNIIDSRINGCDDLIVSGYLANDNAYGICDDGLTPCSCDDSKHGYYGSDSSDKDHHYDKGDYYNDKDKYDTYDKEQYDNTDKGDTYDHSDKKDQSDHYDVVMKTDLDANDYDKTDHYYNYGDKHHDYISNSDSLSYSDSGKHHDTYYHNTVKDDDDNKVDVIKDTISNDLDLGDESVEHKTDKVFVHQLIYTASQPVHGNEEYINPEEDHEYTVHELETPIETSEGDIDIDEGDNNDPDHSDTTDQHDSNDHNDNMDQTDEYHHYDIVDNEGYSDSVDDLSSDMYSSDGSSNSMYSSSDHMDGSSSISSSDMGYDDDKDYGSKDVIETESQSTRHWHIVGDYTDDTVLDPIDDTERNTDNNNDMDQEIVLEVDHDRDDRGHIPLDDDFITTLSMDGDRPNKRDWALPFLSLKNKSTLKESSGYSFYPIYGVLIVFMVNAMIFLYCLRIKPMLEKRIDGGIQQLENLEVLEESSVSDLEADNDDITDDEDDDAHEFSSD